MIDTAQQALQWAKEDLERAKQRLAQLVDHQQVVQGPQRFRLSSTSLKRLDGVHHDLVRVVKTAIRITDVDFMVFEGLRDVERQHELVKQGKSWTLNSRHLTGHAVDLVPYIDGRPRWIVAKTVELWDYMKQAAEIEGVSINWGGDWDNDGDWRDERRFDGAHYQLPRDLYPA